MSLVNDFAFKRHTINVTLNLDMQDTEFFIAAHAWIQEGDKVLVTHRSIANDYKPLFWDIPGGTMEAGESLEETLIREVNEETGLAVKPIRPIFTFTNFESMPERQYVVVVFLCESVDGEIITEPSEHDEYRWVNKSEFDELQKLSWLDAFGKSGAVSL